MATKPTSKKPKPKVPKTVRSVATVSDNLEISIATEVHRDLRSLVESRAYLRPPDRKQRALDWATFEKAKKTLVEIIEADQWADIEWVSIYLRERLVPAYNNAAAHHSTFQRCIECGGRFAIFNKRQISAFYCGDGCASRSRNRGAQKVGDGKSGAERARASAERNMKKHFAKCSECRAGRNDKCGTYHKLIAGLSAADAARYDVEFSEQLLNKNDDD